MDWTAPRRSHELFNVFRAAPPNIAGIIPENKAFDANASDINAVEPLFRHLLQKLILSPAKNPLSSLDFIKAATPTPNNPTARPKRKNWECIIKKEVSAPIAQEEKPHALKITPRTLLPLTETLEFRRAPSIPSYIQIISSSFSSSEVLKPVLRVPMILLQAHDLFLSKKFYV